MNDSRNYTLDNHPAVQAWTQKNFRTEKGFYRHMKLLTDNRDAFTKIFGKRHGTFRGEFFYSVWSVDFNGRTYEIFTAKDKGTCYEIVMEPKERWASVWEDTALGKDMVKFLEFVLGELEAIT